MSDTNNSLINLGNNKVVEEAYKDILSSPGKKIGEALGTIMNIGNTLLWPVKWANEKTRIYFENNLKKYEDKLSQIENDKIIEVPTEISMPILERFTYVSNEEISNAFVKLLASASNIDTIQYAHPSFIQIIDRMSPDEAQIMKHFSKNSAVPYITFSKYSLKRKKAEDLLEKENSPSLNTSEFVTVFKKFNYISENTTLIFPKNISLYLENLISLGLMRDVPDQVYTKFNDDYNKMEIQLWTEFSNAFEDIPENLKINSKRFDQGMFELTDFGRLFITACLE